jgi:hypothetical protein
MNGSENSYESRTPARLHAYGTPLRGDALGFDQGVIEIARLEDINDVYHRLKTGEIAGRAVIAPAA